MRPTASLDFSIPSEELQARWRHECTTSPVHSGRSRSSGVGADRLGRDVCPVARTKAFLAKTHSHREIRLSLPLFDQLAARTPYAEQELLNTLAHEMIHQWQFDMLKRRPDHGLEFLRKMTQMNQSGEVAVTTYHSLEKEVMALSKFAWRCRDCGRLYRDTEERSNQAPQLRSLSRCSAELICRAQPVSCRTPSRMALPRAGRIHPFHRTDAIEHSNN